MVVYDPSYQCFSKTLFHTFKMESNKTNAWFCFSYESCSAVHDILHVLLIMSVTFMCSGISHFHYSLKCAATLAQCCMFLFFFAAKSVMRAQQPSFMPLSPVFVTTVTWNEKKKIQDQVGFKPRPSALQSGVLPQSHASAWNVVARDPIQL